MTNPLRDETMTDEALAAWCEEEARVNRMHAVRIGNDERAKNLELIAARLREKGERT